MMHLYIMKCGEVAVLVGQYCLYDCFDYRFDKISEKHGKLIKQATFKNLEYAKSLFPNTKVLDNIEWVE